MKTRKATRHGKSGVRCRGEAAWLKGYFAEIASIPVIADRPLHSSHTS